MDEFDEILFLEERYIKEGYEEGERDAVKVGYTDGFELGYLRGYEYSKEISYYKTICQHFIDQKSISTLSAKATRALEQVINAANEFPVSNDPSVDIIQCLHNVRIKFKMVGVVLNWKDNEYAYSRTESREEKPKFDF